jgi:hypothetical protein
MSEGCPFCEPREVLFENDLAFGIYDKQPTGGIRGAIARKRKYP